MTFHKYLDIVGERTSFIEVFDEYTNDPVAFVNSISDLITIRLNDQQLIKLMQDGGVVVKGEDGISYLLYFYEKKVINLHDDGNDVDSEDA